MQLLYRTGTPRTTIRTPRGSWAVCLIHGISRATIRHTRFSRETRQETGLTTPASAVPVRRPFLSFVIISLHSCRLKAWYAAYPTSTPDPSKYPAQWVNALNAAVSAGKIPDIPVSTSSNGDNPVYPNNLSPTSPEVCSATYQCRNLEYDIWDAPNGTVGIGFDDGPLPVRSFRVLHRPFSC